jgi:hypothetical protein
MYGVVDGNWDSLNESSYTSTKYGYIPVGHFQFPHPGLLGILRKPLNPTTTLDADAINALARVAADPRYWDTECIDFYLDERFVDRLPKFGRGQYRCSDIAP